MRREEWKLRRWVINLWRRVAGSFGLEKIVDSSRQTYATLPPLNSGRWSHTYSNAYMLKSDDIWTHDAKKSLERSARADAIREALASLSSVELLQLGKYASYRMKPLTSAGGRSAEDLLGEAITATLDGQRTWSEGIDFFTHLVGCMTSISSNWRRKSQKEILVQESEAGFFDSVASQAADAERILSATEELERIRRIFAEDDEASQAVELLAQGYKGSEIKECLGLSEKEYAAVSKRIRRKLEKLLRPRQRVAGNAESEGSAPKTHP